MSLRDRELAPLVQARHRRSAETLAQRPPARGVPCINSILLRTILRTLVLLHTCPLELLQKYEVEHHHHFDLAITHSRTRSMAKPKPATGLGACKCSMWHPRKKYIRGSTANSKQTPAPPKRSISKVLGFRKLQHLLVVNEADNHLMPPNMPQHHVGTVYQNTMTPICCKCNLEFPMREKCLVFFLRCGAPIDVQKIKQRHEIKRPPSSL